MFFLSFPLTSYGIKVIAGSENFTSERYLLKVPTRTSLFASAKSIYYLCMLHTLLPSIFMTGVHPPSPHPKSPMWQRIWVGFELKIIVTTWFWLDLHKETFWTPNQSTLERFSFEFRKVIGFALSTRCDWLKRFASPFHPIRSKNKANCDALACIFPRFSSATCNYFEFWLVQCIVCVLCDWPE